jgi:hypothetical protein
MNPPPRACGSSPAPCGHGRSRPAASDPRSWRAGWSCGAPSRTWGRSSDRRPGDPYCGPHGTNDCAIQAGHQEPGRGHSRDGLGPGGDQAHGRDPGLRRPEDRTWAQSHPRGDGDRGSIPGWSFGRGPQRRCRKRTQGGRHTDRRSRGCGQCMGQGGHSFHWLWLCCLSFRPRRRLCR